MIHEAPSPILVIDLAVLLFHHAPSPISVFDLSVLLFHQAPSPILLIDLSELQFHQAGQTPKELMRIEQEEWLDIPGNFDKWASQSLSASERRILTTHWIGEAWQKFSSNKYQHIINSSFKVTGPREGDKEDCGHMVNEHCPEVLPLNITKELQFDR